MKFKFYFNSKLFFNIFKILVDLTLIVCNYFVCKQSDLVNPSLKKLLYIFLILMLFIINKKNTFAITKPLILILSPIVSFFIVEFLSLSGANPFSKYSFKIILVNLLIYYFIYSILYIIINIPKLSLFLCYIIFYIISIANHFIVIYRGRGLFPNDIFSLKTATTIIDNISLDITTEMIIITYISIIWLFLLIKAPIKRKKFTSNLRIKIPILLISLIGIYLFTFSNLLFKIGFKQVHWYGHLTNGLALNFTIETNLNRISKPNNYSESTLKNIKSEVDNLDISTISTSNSTLNEKPNIIVIMDESFADLRCIGNFQTNKPVMEFLDSLSKNTIKGYALSSVYGGGTATSEFEFLTGTSTAFLPSSTIAYQSYINNKTDSLVSILKEQGYSTIAIHPYQGNNYNRPNAYKNLGFDKYYHAENLYITPDNDLRNLASDYYDFNKLIELYNEKKADEKLFIFNVTIQNHGGYEDVADNFNEQIRINNFSKDDYPAANQYLSLLYETDKALKNLISYFDNVDEPTIILMFGDHQGMVEDEFINYLYGKKQTNLSLEEKQKLYTIPFYIWANYDINEKFIDCTSINYLSTYLLDVAGVKRSNYFKYLTYLRNEIPAINNFCYVDLDGNYHPIENNAIPKSENKLLNKYQILQYNYLFDSKHKLSNFYSLPN